MRSKPRPTEYTTWIVMRARCHNPKDKDYRHYGGRGITVCARWDSYAAFFADMGRRPKGRVLDRIDNDGNYEPGNCRWATRLEQMANTRAARWIEYKGERKVLAQWARDVGIAQSNMYWYLRRYGEQGTLEYLFTRRNK